MEDPRALTQPIRELVTSMCCWFVAQTQQTDILPVLAAKQLYEYERV